MRDLITLVEGLDDTPEATEVPSWKIEEQYAYGDCDILALALHRKYGLPIRAVVFIDEEDGEEGYSHVWVSYQGKALDIWGVRSEAEIEQAWIIEDDQGGQIKSVSEEWLLSTLPQRQRVNLPERVAQALVDFTKLHGPLR